MNSQIEQDALEYNLQIIRSYKTRNPLEYSSRTLTFEGNIDPLLEYLEALSNKNKEKLCYVKNKILKFKFCIKMDCSKVYFDDNDKAVKASCVICERIFELTYPMNEQWKMYNFFNSEKFKECFFCSKKCYVIYCEENDI